MRRLLRFKRDRKADAREVRLAQQRREVGSNGWTCHVCGDYRPDARISVFSKTKTMGTLPFQQNVRYCNDRTACIAGVRHVELLGES